MGKTTLNANELTALEKEQLWLLSEQQQPIGHYATREKLGALGLIVEYKTPLGRIGHRPTILGKIIVGTMRLEKLVAGLNEIDGVTAKLGEIVIEIEREE